MTQSVPEAVFPFLGYRYARVSATNRFPVQRGCLPKSLTLEPGDDRLIDCSSFVTASLVYMHPEIDWDEQAYDDMQIMDASRLWSPVDAWQRHGVGEALPKKTAAPQWGVYQSWVDDQLPEFDGDGISGGHQWFYHRGLGVRVHSSSRGLVGPTYEHVSWDTLLEKYPASIRGVALR
jgi:hypothetical protein